MRPTVLLPLLALAAVPSGCMPGYHATDRGPQAYYQTGYPVRDVSADLQRITRSVKRTQVTGFYETHRFALADSVTAAAVRQRATYRKATERYSFDHTKTGSATILQVALGVATLVTNVHVTSLPDTIVVYYREQAAGAGTGRPTPWVESVSVLVEQRSLVIGLPGAKTFRVAARDTLADVAVLQVSLGDDVAPQDAPALAIRAGDASRLTWGSFVYVVGYPRGFQMVTRGIVSDPNRSRDHEFLLDGLFNRGISGGLVLAVRGDTNELEWVGLATSASAEADYRLMPEARVLEEPDFQVPYEGRLYLQQTSRIDYGVTFTTPVNAVQRVLREHQLPVSQLP